MVSVQAAHPLKVIAAVLTVLAAPAFFVFEEVWSGVLLLALGLGFAWYADRGGCEGACTVPLDPADQRLRGDRGTAASSRPPSLLRDLSLIAMGLGIVRTIHLAAELDNLAMLRFALALGGAVAVPYLVSRFVYRDRAISFPWRGGSAAHGGSPQSEAWGIRGHDGNRNPRWGLLHWSWMVAVLVLGWLILPWYFIGSGVYQNWPVVDTSELIARLFVGVGAVGIWDELFFICTVFVLLLRHFPAWLANLLQAVVFVSFLWELGYQAWGPLLTIPFALVQGFIFLRTRSLSYVVVVHLLFDAVVFAVLVHAHNPSLFDIFPTAP